MPKNLIIVESPTKAKTISKFLDKNYTVKSSFGHLRDLPKSKLGVDVENGFEPEYTINPKSKKIVSELKKIAKESDEIILASDEDREGEAIAWHLAHILGIDLEGKSKSKKGYKRIVFHEITKSAILEALQNPRQLDFNLVDAQQARRVLDRLVGYKLSPFLWKKIRYGLSAGRVQSVAVRLIVEREREIQNFKKDEYWEINADLSKKDKSADFLAKLVRVDKKTLKKLDIKTQKEAEVIKTDLEKENYIIEKIEKKETKKNPLPPFTTSTLQQAANNRLGYSSKQTMMIAQQLYEGIDIGSGGSVGLITYMRTDSLNLSKESLEKAQNYITNHFGKEYAEQRFFKTKSKGAQEAHEAIRPTDPSRTPESIKEFLDPKQYKLYMLIWQRMLASQMASAISDLTTIEIAAGKYTLRSSGSTIKFEGFLKVYPMKTEEIIFPELKEKEELELLKILADQHFTQPPARYNEASLVKALEEFGIGRPSTYAPIISTIQDRGYVRKEEKRFMPEEIGFIVNDFLVEHFPDIVDIAFTAKMEEDLDKVAEGKHEWRTLMGDFYNPFVKNLNVKEKEVDKKAITEEKTDEKCPECGSPMIIKLGRFGKFMACSNYPTCKTTKPIGEEKKLNEEFSDEVCEKCGKPMVVKRGRFGTFLGCSGYPDCKNIKSLAKPTGAKCPECGKGDIVEKKSKAGRIFYACNNYPDCKYAMWQKPTGEKCPKCESLMVYAAKEKQICSNKECKYEKE